MATNKQNLLNQLDEFHRTLTPTLSSSNKDLFTNEFAKVKALANGVPEIPTWFAGSNLANNLQTQMQTQIIELINLLKKVTTNQTNLEANIATQVDKLSPKWTSWTGLIAQLLIFLLLVTKLWWEFMQKRQLQSDLTDLQEHLKKQLK